MIAWLHKATLDRLAKAAAQPFQGCSIGAKHCALPGPWQRRLRELDAIVGWPRKLNPEKCYAFLQEFNELLAEAGGKGHEQREGSVQETKQMRAEKEQWRRALLVEPGSNTRRLQRDQSEPEKGTTREGK